MHDNYFLRENVPKIAVLLCYIIQSSSYDNLENILPLTKRPQLVNNIVGSWGVDIF